MRPLRSRTSLLLLAALITAAVLPLFLLLRNPKPSTLAELEIGMTRDEMFAAAGGRWDVQKIYVFEAWGDDPDPWWNLVALGDGVESYTYKSPRKTVEIFFFRGSDRISHIEIVARSD